MTSTSHPTPTLAGARPTADTWLDSPDAFDAYVAAFEEAHARAGAADVAAHLPPADHPLFLRVLCELVRVDLEFGWTHGRPTPLDGYRRRFPALFADPEATQAVAFEEYRLRRQAGERPAPAEYEARYGVDTSDWPAAGPAALDGVAVVARSLVARSPDRDTPEGTIRQPITPVGPPSATVMAPALVEGAARDYAAFRRRSGDPAAVEQSIRRFEELCHSEPQRASRLAHAVTRLPEVGDVFAGFRLIGELGRGAFGRVFLAEQTDLAGRPVALKVTPDADGGESQTLAQLQHTNVMPIYSVHHAGPLQAVCMPYFGATTLADVLDTVRLSGSLPASGQGLLSTL